jgi:hypothetical protein
VSASLVVDLGQTCLLQPSIAPTASVDSTPASGVIVGNVVDLLDANTLTNLLVTAGVSLSGAFKVAVQTASGTSSGWFTDPTSGLAVMPTNLLSGGILLCNSGQASGVFASGMLQAGGFLSPHRYARAMVLSGDLNNAPVFAGFVKQLKQTGSGTGTTQAPQPNVALNV